MPCYHPLKGWIGDGGKVTFSRNHSKSKNRIDLPCGRCIGCRLEKSREWAARCYHEASLYQDSMFVTLTYSDEHLPEHGTLVKAHPQKFLKRLRKHLYPNWIRFYMCGEYGDTTERPHYHLLIFGHRFPDAYPWNHKRGNTTYRSDTLERLWPYGHSDFGNVTFQSAAYVARYIIKKQNGDNAIYEYGEPDPETGEVIQTRIPPYTCMSLGKVTDPKDPDYDIRKQGGIGYGWYQKYKNDLFPADRLVLQDGKEMPVPKYYRELLKREDPDLYDQLRKQRIEKAKKSPDNTPERLAVREFVKEDKIHRLKREL